MSSAINSKSKRQQARRIARIGAVAGSPRPRILQGHIEAVCKKTRTVTRYGNERGLRIHFYIISGPNEGTELVEHCRYPEVLAPSHKLYKEWATLIGRKPERGEGFDPQVFLDKLCVIEVRDVRTTSQGEEVPEYGVYSVVDHIVKVLQTNQCPEAE